MIQRLSHVDYIRSHAYYTTAQDVRVSLSIDVGEDGELVESS